MYGDLRHISVMQSEIENELDFDEIQHFADKYSKSFNSHHNQRQGKAATTEKKATKNEERKNYRNGDSSEPHFRPVNNKQRTKPPKVVDKSSLIDNQIAEEMKSKSTSVNATEISGKTTKLTSITSPSSSTTPGSIKSTSETANDNMTKESDQENNEAIDKAVFDLFSNISSVFAASTTSTTFETSTLSKTVSENTQEPSIIEKNSQIESGEEITLSEEINNEDKETSSTLASKEPIATTTTGAQLFQDSMIVQIPVNKRGV
jgi:hypothetical protein